MKYKQIIITAILTACVLVTGFTVWQFLQLRKAVVQHGQVISQIVEVLKPQDK